MNDDITSKYVMFRKKSVMLCVMWAFPCYSLCRWTCVFMKNKGHITAQRKHVCHCANKTGLFYPGTNSWNNYGRWQKMKWKKSEHGHRIAHSVARTTHVPRLYSRPGFDSRPRSLCCVSLPVSYPVSCPILQLYYQIRPKKYFKKSEQRVRHCCVKVYFPADVFPFTRSTCNGSKLTFCLLDE